MDRRKSINLGLSLLRRAFRRKQLLKEQREEDPLVGIEFNEDIFTIKFGVCGTIDSGKTSTINALFGTDLYVGHLLRGTDKVEEVEIRQNEVKVEIVRNEEKDGTSEIIFYDFPGLQESLDRNDQIRKEYSKFLPECDVILYVLEASQKRLAFDEEFLTNILTEDLKKKTVVGLCKFDELYPKDWNDEDNLPSYEQLENIDYKKELLSKQFKIAQERFVEYCALEDKNRNKTRKFNLKRLARRLIEACDKEHAYLLEHNIVQEVFEKTV